MSELFVQIIGGLIVAILAFFFGISGNRTKVVVQGTRVRKTGKWIIFISVLMILGGLTWAGSGSPSQGGFDFNKPATIYGLTLAGYGFIFLIVGKIVAW